MNSRRFGWLLGASGVLVAIAVAYGAQGSREKGEHQAGHEHGTVHAEHHETAAGGLSIPQPLAAEHHELHEELLKATNEAGEVGEAAKVVAELLHPHFVKEEEYALPLLGLLDPISKGDTIPEAQEAIAMSAKLKADLPQMLEEHRQIVAALGALKEAANEAGQDEYIHFADKLTLHAQTEEQVLYPAAILVGQYLKLTTHK